jgi:hypothetical protein
MKKIEAFKKTKTKVLNENLPLSRLKKILKKRKKRALEVLKNKAQLYVKSEHQDLFCKRLARDKKMNPAVMYNIGYALGKSLPSPAPRKMGISAVCTLLIYRDYGQEAFKEFFGNLLKESNKT